MKKLFVNVSTKENKVLNKQFQFLKDENYSEKIKCLHVSIFDHTLSWDEAENLLYSDIPEEECNNRNHMLLNFIKILIDNKTVYTWRYQGRHKRKIQFKSFLSQKALQLYVIPYEVQYKNNHGHKSWWTHLVIPDLSITIFETGDYGYEIYYLYDDCIGLINDIVKQAKLHII